MSLQQMQRTPWRLVRAAAQWHLTSQQQSRRNALVASTALTERRRELLDVEEFLAARADQVPPQRVAGRTT
jgi:hypothetical protein